MQKVYTISYGVYYLGSQDYGGDLERVFGSLERAKEAVMLHCFEVAVSEGGEPGNDQYLAIGEMDISRRSDREYSAILRGVIVFTKEFDPEDTYTHLSPMNFIYRIKEVEVE